MPVTTTAPRDTLSVAEGYRYLSRLLRGGLEASLEFGDPLFPQFRCPAHETLKLGADNPDNRYESCAVDPAQDYRELRDRLARACRLCRPSRHARNHR